jgi:MFS family permease
MTRYSPAVPASPIALVRALPAPVRVLVLGTFVNKAGTLILPYLSIVLQRDFGLSPGATGLALLGYGAGSVVSILVGGVLTDALGRRRTLAISLLGGGAVALGMSVAPSLAVLVGLLLAFGFLSELYRPASSAIVTDLLSSHQRPIGFAALRLAVNFGFAVGMVAGGWLTGVSWRLLFLGDGLTTLAFGAVVLARVPETKVAVAPGSAPAAGPSFLGDGPFLLSLLASLLYSLVFFTDFTVLPLAVTAAGHSPTTYGMLVAVNGILIGLFEMSVVDAVRRFRRLRVAALGVLFTAAGFALVGASRAWPWLLLSVVVWTIGEILTVPQVMSFVSDWAPPSVRGRYIGAYGATWSLGMALGPPLFLPLHARLGDDLFWPLLGLVALPALFIQLGLDARVDRRERLRGFAAA